MLVVATEPLKQLGAVLFDLDGTLIDTVDLIHRSFDQAVRQVLGESLSRAELLQNMGRPLAFQMQAFSPNHVEELLDAYNEHNLKEHDQHIRAYPGVLDVLRLLKFDHGLPLAIVTSKKRDLCLRGLELTRIEGFFDVVVAMEDTVQHKPKPEPVLKALEELEQEAARAIFIGDSPFDIEAGKQAGTRTAAALWGPFEPPLLRALDPDFEAQDMRELYSLLFS
jgi:pyrophosphatase PpaX